MGLFCYDVFSVENPNDIGSTENFLITVNDPINGKLKYKTYGNLNYPTTLSFIRSGLSIIVGEIPDIVVGTSSNDISITLELSVSYAITLTPDLLLF